MNVAVIIPARMGSTRFPGKPLADETGRPLVVHVADRASEATGVDSVVVASDSDEIGRAVRAFGHVHVLTDVDHPNGTSRVAQAAAGLNADIIVNVQGDEPEIDPATIEAAIDALRGDPDAAVGTVATPLADQGEIDDPHVVKVAFDDAGRALSFSRLGASPDCETPGPTPYRHVGVYAYRPGFLRAYPEMEPTRLEQAESLEQLRVLEHGYGIAVRVHHVSHPGIDTPGQYAAFVRRWAARQAGDRST